ncbi:MAG: prolipoprotein diacylglyceryl transferase [Deltaproteobacteria bacterium]|nr:prolipoprotein diacylglyceryl transferase [Deltaproteobacteria bacterium]
MRSSGLQLLCLSAAFWVAVLGYRGRAPLRLLGGLVLGALSAHLGWALLRADVVAQHPALLLDPRAGFCVLFVPLGMLAVAPWRDGEPGVRAFLSGTFAVLPLALAVARLGCVLVGCCGGGGRAGSGLPPHAVALYDVAGLIALHFVLRRTPRALVACVFCTSFGGLRLLLEPLRGGPSTAAPLMAPTLLAGAWLVFGLLLSLGPLRSSPSLRSLGFAFAVDSAIPAKADSRSPTLRLPHRGDS